MARRDGSTWHFGRTLWLGRLDDAVLLEALRAWVVGGGPSSAQRPEEELPAELAPARSRPIQRGPRPTAP